MKRSLQLLSLCLILTPGPALSGPSGTLEAAATKAAEAGFSELEKRLIRDYYATAGSQVDRPGGDGRPADRDDGHKGKKRGGHKDGKGHGHKGKSGSLPPGLARRGELPPGLERQLERRGTLPPGLAKRQLPPELERRLGPPPEGTERVIVDDDVVLVEKASGIIVDILKDVLKK